MASRGVIVVTLWAAVCSNEAYKVRSGLTRRSFKEADLEVARSARSLQNKKIKSKEDVMASMTSEKAYAIFKKLNDTAAQGHLVNLVDGQLIKKVVATREAVDRGRDLLNGIMDQTTNKKELEIVRCDEFDHKQLTVLLELEQDLAYVNSEAAGARSQILSSEEVIQVNEEIKIPQTKIQLREHNEECETQLGTLHQQLYIVKNDTEVMKNILSLLCTEPQSPVFLQLASRQRSSTIVKCTSCTTGQELAWLRQDRIRPLMAQLQSDDAKRYVREHLLEAFDESAIEDPNVVKTTALTQQEMLHEIKRSIPGVNMQGIVERPNDRELDNCNELLNGKNGTLYRGCQRTTDGGVPCQEWSSQTPNAHTDTVENFPDDGLTENFCRNPGAREQTIWCYTSEGTLGWDYCKALPLVKMPPATEPHVCAESGSCKMSGASCKRLTDRFMVILAGFVDQRNKFQNDIDTLYSDCAEVRHIYEYSISAAETQVREEQSNLATATKLMTESLQQSKLMNRQHKDLTWEYHDEMSKCCDNRNEFTDEICALKKIRGELYRMEDMVPGISDCEVTEWTNDECTKSCEGGKQKRSRTIMIHPVNGTKCPPLRMDRSCNTQGCPIDCRVDDWTEWSECTALCGGGIKQRTRERLIEPENNGDPCDEQSEAVPCNVAACDQDCTLHDWSDWGLCSKACEGGHETRTRSIKDEVVGQGTCPHPEFGKRMQFKECNPFDCSQLIHNDPWRLTLECTAKIDLILLIDGSSSLKQYGWNMIKKVTKRLTSAMVGGDDGVNLGVLVFGGPRSAADLEACTSSDQYATPDAETQCGIHWVQRLNGDMSVAEESVEGMNWPDSTTFTSMALLEAKAELLNGRQDATSVVVVITDGRPMSPIRTGQASAAVRDVSRLIWVAVGMGRRFMNKFANKWASKPAQDSVLFIQRIAQMNTPWFINDMIATMCHSVK